ncbi:DUF4902 domain-containing protein [Burkholderia sp. 22PA0106]|uniref:DUF4902 domain-containing protein n=1 Tax=Burkholderia sp. 22PA0106 TaxID=3237371 RepID=UPI0039C19E51
MHVISQNRMPNDGYVRLPRHQLRVLSFAHRATELDRSLLDELNVGNIMARCAGITEWECRSDTCRYITVGWDWFVDECGRTALADDDVRSNVMLLDETGRDLGMRQTANAFRDVIERLDWQRVVGEFAADSAVGRPG